MSVYGTTYGEVYGGVFGVDVTPVYPDPSDVLLGVVYGPTGTDYTGTLTGGSGVDEQVIQDIISGVVAGVAGVPLNPHAPVQGAHLDVYKGDAYASSQGVGRRLPFAKAASETTWPTTLSSVTLTIQPTPEAIARGDATALQSINAKSGTIVQATGDQAVYFELTAIETAALAAGGGMYTYWVVANGPTYPATLRSGSCTVRPNPISV